MMTGIRHPRVFVADTARPARGGLCSIEGCGKPVYALGWCSRHWTANRRHGDPLGGPGTGNWKRTKVMLRPPIFLPEGDAKHGPFWIIPLTKDESAYVSDERFHRYRVGDDNWCVTVERNGLKYAGRAINRKDRKEMILLHHQIGFKWHDHGNGNGLDCRDENMRKPPTFAHNLANRFVPKRSANASIYKGVQRNPDSKRKPWTAGITVNGKRRYLGSFTTEVAAALAYDRAALAAWGEYAAINFKRPFLKNRYLFETCPRIPRR